MRIVAVDIGGTHARFAWAELSGGGIRLEPETVLKTGAFAGLVEAWTAFLGDAAPPEGAAIAIAAQVGADQVKLTNNDWTLRPADLAAQLGVGQVHLVNDFAAVAHAVPHLTDLRHVCGPDLPLPDAVITVVGPGTGLGVAILDRSSGHARVTATEGGHIGFAPTDAVEDRILARLRARHGRVSAERVVCGRGLTEVHAVVAGEDIEDRELWLRALAGEPRIAPSLDRYCGLLGAVAGDLTLAHGAAGVVIGGGIGLRLKDILPMSSFAERFQTKGRFAQHMDRVPVRLITHAQPGLLGAAAAYASIHAR